VILMGLSRAAACGGVKYSFTSWFFHRRLTPSHTITLRRRPCMTCRPPTLKPSDRPRCLPWRSEGMPSTADAAPVPAEGIISIELAGATVSVATANIEALGLRMESAGGQRIETSPRAGPDRGYSQTDVVPGGGCWRTSKESHLVRAIRGQEERCRIVARHKIHPPVCKSSQPSGIHYIYHKRTFSCPTAVPSCLRSHESSSSSSALS